jgi:hypothetical protein
MAAKCASMNNKIFIIVINCPFGAKGQLPVAGLKLNPQQRLLRISE